VLSQRCEKRLISLVMSVCPSVSMEWLGYFWSNFHEIWYLNIFRKYVEVLQVTWKSDKNNGYVTLRPIYLCDHISLISSSNEKCFRKKVARKIKTHFMFNNVFRQSCHLWDNVEKYCSARQTTDDNMAHARCMPNT